MVECRYLGRLVNGGAAMCFAGGGVALPHCSEDCPDYERADLKESEDETGN